MNGDQLTLDVEPLVAVDVLRDEPLEDRFRRFHAANPHVYRELVKLARWMRREHGISRIGIALLFERLRWDHAIKTRGDRYRLNSSFRSLYSRLIMKQEPDLDGFFEIRRLRSLD